MKRKPFGLSRVALRNMVEVARISWERGWAAGTAGNFSVAADETVWMSPSGRCKGHLSPDLFVPLNQKLESLQPGVQKFSEEAPVHFGIYQHLGFHGTVVHVHPPELVEATREHEFLRFEGEEMQKALGCVEVSEVLEIPLAPNPKRHEFENLQNCLGDYWSEKAQMLIVRSHGVWAWGADPFDALNRIEALEHLCNVAD